MRTILGKYIVNYTDFCDCYGKPNVTIQQYDCLCTMSWLIHHPVSGEKLQLNYSTSCTNTMEIDIPLEYDEKTHASIYLIILEIYKNKTASQLAEILKRDHRIC